MSHEPIIIDSLAAHYEVPVIKKRCRVWQLIAGAFLVGGFLGAVLF